MTNNDSKYTDPELRTEIKENIQDSDKGGKPGQWSARKAQMMASEYKKAMEERGDEPYTTEKSEKDNRQKHLSEWTNEEWQTSDGKAEAKQADGSEKRYLPKEAWEKMTEDEKTETNEAKLEGCKEGKQHVPNTDAAKAARRKDVGERTNGTNEEANKDTDIGKDSAKGQSGSANANSKRERPNEEEPDDVDERSTTDDELASSAEERDKDSRPRKKAKTDEGKQKQVGKRSVQKAESNDSGIASEEHGEPSNIDRLPEEGQRVCWRAASGWCEGTVVEILYEEKEVAGRQAKASQNDPRIVLKSAKSGKSAVHKPSAVYF